MRVNRETVLSATSVDTQPASNAWTDQIYLLASSVSGPVWRFDDLCVIDPTTGTPDDFLGDFRIQTLYPVSDVSVDATPSTGSDNYAMLDENPADGDSSYVETDGGADVYTFDSVDGVVVYGVAINAVVRETDAESFDVSLLANSGASDPQTIGSSAFVNRNAIFETNPDTSEAWTTEEVNDLEAGFSIE